MALPTLQQKSVEPLLYIRQLVSHPSPYNNVRKAYWRERYQTVIIQQFRKAKAVALQRLLGLS